MRSVPHCHGFGSPWVLRRFFSHIISTHAHVLGCTGEGRAKEHEWLKRLECQQLCLGLSILKLVDNFAGGAPGFDDAQHDALQGGTTCAWANKRGWGQVDGRESGEGAWLVLEGNATRLAPITTAGSFRFVVCITYLPFGSLPSHFSFIFCSTETAMCVHGDGISFSATQLATDRRSSHFTSQ